MRVFRSIGVVVLLLLLASPAAAQDPEDPCEPPPEGVDQTFPADRAAQVALDVVVRVRYGASPPRDAEAQIEVREAVSDAVAGGSAQRTLREIVWVPATPLRPNTRYEVLAPDPLLGVNLSTFTTGTRMEAGPPTFGSIEDVTSEPVELAACGAPGGGFRITTSFAAALDDGPAEDVEYVVYQTRGPGVVEPLERARVRGLSGDSQFAAFLLPREQASSPICLAALAYDGRGARGGDGKESCLDPVQGNYFASCAAAGGAARGSAGLALGTTWLALSLVWRRAVRRACSGRRARRRAPSSTG